jgi:hypothetical protein
MKMERINKDVIYTVGKFTKEYKEENKDCKATEYQINQFLKNTFDEIVDEIILNAYQVEIGRMFNVSFKRYQRNFDKLAVNFGESNKLKNKLLAEGKKLATKIGTTSNGNPIFDDGEPWMIYFTDPYYVSSSYSPKKLISPDGTYKEYKMRNMWDLKQHTKLLARFGNYEKQNKINKLDIPLHYGSKNNIL